MLKCGARHGMTWQQSCLTLQNLCLRNEIVSNRNGDDSQRIIAICIMVRVVFVMHRSIILPLPNLQ
jgi:hypothetical protein